ncbi:hypothetical protein BKA67DRAFT_641853 [Truncatella angustata]|uniref:Uncharacterized protein n=1 Tax=Truncatella angustata TaxID=152316 RepID=A0A9P8UYR3_9PEZI|nr:uncharacterized protein BKA67DRAFT_641853 [Truncatella angustata]KAH6660807.1 hypothetical protein BKA67DRAFT_641853 [Truncatella angustata]
MCHIPIWTFLLPLVVCLPLFIQESKYPASSEVLPVGLKWIDLAQFDWDDYVLSGISLNCDRESVDQKYNCAYKFHWDDPNYDNSMDCSYSFPWDGVTQTQGDNNSYPTGYQSCGDSWQFKFEVVRYLWDFNMTISKLQDDPSKFGRYSAWFFAYPNITLERMSQLDFRSLVYSTIDPVKAKIQGLAM